MTHPILQPVPITPQVVEKHADFIKQLHQYKSYLLIDSDGSEEFICGRQIIAKWYSLAGSVIYLPLPEGKGKEEIIKKWAFHLRESAISEENVLSEAMDEYLASNLPKQESNIMEEGDIDRLYSWLIDKNREPARTKFTNGALRNIANEIEYRLYLPMQGEAEIKPQPKEKMMKVHSGSFKKEFVNVPKYVPFSILNEENAYRNHTQTLDRLNERGGLGVDEMLDIIHGRKYGTTKDSQQAIDELNKIIASNMRKETKHLFENIKEPVKTVLVRELHKALTEMYEKEGKMSKEKSYLEFCDTIAELLIGLNNVSSPKPQEITEKKEIEFGDWYKMKGYSRWGYKFYLSENRPRKYLSYSELYDIYESELKSRQGGKRE